MTTQELAPLADLAPVTQVIGGSLPGLDLLREWLAAAGQARDLVRPLVDTPFLPSSLWPLPPGVQPRDMPNPRIKHPRESVEEWQGRREVAGASGTAAVLTGMTLGLDPLVALAQVFVVKGRPGLYAKIKVALAQRAGHDVWDEELTAERVTVCGRRKGWPEDRIVRITLTIEDAERAGWTTNEAYRKTPADMLWSRCAGRVVDRIGADTLNGIASIEDADDLPVQVTATVTDEPAPVRASAAAILARAAAPDSVAPQVRMSEETPVEAPEVPPEPPVHQYVMPVSKPRLDAIRDRFIEIGLGGARPSVAERAQRMTVVNAIVSRDADIDDPREMTADEGALVLDSLAGTAGQRLVSNALDRPDLAPAAEPMDGELDPAAVAAARQSVEDEGRDFDPTAEQYWPGGQP